MNPVALISLLIILPFAIGILGLVLLALYWILGALRPPKRKPLLIAGYICIGIPVLTLLFFFLIGALGLGPVPT